MTREAWRPKVGGGAGACLMAGIIRAFPAIYVPLLWQYLDPHNICPSLFCKESISAFTFNELDLMGLCAEQ